MKRLKSIFISAAVMVWTYFTFLFVSEFIVNGFTLLAAGLFLVAVLPFGFFMGLLALRPVARTSRSLNWFTASIAVGFILVVIAVWQNGLAYNNLLIAAVSFGLWLTYLYWYSTLPKPIAALAVGNKLAELTFSDRGTPFSAADISGKKVLYLFYRGNWCPLCVAQIKEISAQYQELEKRGVEVLLISPQPVGHSVHLAKKMKVNFRFLTDTNNAMARKLKLDVAHGVPLGMEVLGYKSETVLPTVIITDEQSDIIFVDQTDNYRIRPEPKTFLKALDDHKKI